MIFEFFVRVIVASKLLLNLLRICSKFAMQETTRNLAKLQSNKIVFLGLCWCSCFDT